MDRQHRVEHPGARRPAPAPPSLRSRASSNLSLPDSVRGPSRDWPTLERRFADKNMDELRKSLHLYEFSTRTGPRNSPSRVVELSDTEVPIEFFEKMAIAERGEGAHRTSVRGEAGALLETTSSDWEDDVASRMSEEEYHTVELRPHVFIMAKGGGLWPARTALARTGFSVALPIDRCRQELQIALNHNAEMCHLKKFVKNSVLLDIIDPSTGKGSGLARALVETDKSERRDDVAPWSAASLPTQILIDVPINADNAVQRLLPKLLARVRCHFESVVEEDSAKSADMENDPSPETEDSAGPSISRPKSVATSLVSTSTGRRSVDSRSSGSVSKDRRRVQFRTLKKPERVMRDVARLLDDQGYSIRNKPNIGLEVDLADPNATSDNATKAIVSAISSGPGGIGLVSISWYFVVVRAKVVPESKEADMFDVLCSCIQTLFTGFRTANNRSGTLTRR